MDHRFYLWIDWFVWKSMKDYQNSDVDQAETTCTINLSFNSKYICDLHTNIKSEGFNILAWLVVSQSYVYFCTAASMSCAAQQADSLMPWLELIPGRFLWQHLEMRNCWNCLTHSKVQCKREPDQMKFVKLFSVPHLVKPSPSNYACLKSSAPPPHVKEPAEPDEQRGLFGSSAAGQHYL